MTMAIATRSEGVNNNINTFIIIYKKWTIKYFLVSSVILIIIFNNIDSNLLAWNFKQHAFNTFVCGKFVSDSNSLRSFPRVKLPI